MMEGPEGSTHPCKKLAMQCDRVVCGLSRKPDYAPAFLKRQGRGQQGYSGPVLAVGALYAPIVHSTDIHSFSPFFNCSVALIDSWETKGP